MMSRRVPVATVKVVAISFGVEIKKEEDGWLWCVLKI
jgi:hypothetical protein